MSVWYLELDDEITDAVARLRAAKDDRVVFVVPPGSRIGTGRINFRLLAREAETRGLGIALVSGDAQVRALAASAGLAVFATVSESEAAPTTSLIPTDAATSAAINGSPVATTSTAPGPAASLTGTPDARASRAGKAPAPTIGRRPRSRKRRVALMGAGVALVALVGGGGLYGVYVSGSATVDLTQGASPVPPATITMTTADGQTTDPGSGVVAGRLLSFPVTAKGLIDATGVVQVGQRARGTVTFTNHGLGTVPVSDQTTVSTASGVKFLTQAAVELPPGVPIDVEVAAAELGQQGDVPAHTITVMDPDLAASMPGGTVTNKEPTSGGTLEQRHVIQQSDFDSASAFLSGQLSAELSRQALTPPDLSPDEVAFPGSAAISAPTTNPLAPDLVGQYTEQPLEISATATGTVLAVTREALQQVAVATLERQMPAGADLLPDSVAVTFQGAGPTPGSWSATATGRALNQTIDKPGLKRLLAGKTISQAQSILKEYGSATISLSPDFLPTLPDDPARISLIVNQQPAGSAAP